jgi:hypothetical protein
MDILNLKPIITDSTISQFNSILQKIFDDIQTQYDIPKKELEERYLIGNISEIIIEPKLKKSSKIDKDQCCLARKQDGGQCTRRRKDGEDYCGKHLVQRKYGRIDDNEVICTTETTHIPEDKVATWEVKFGDKIYLRDMNNIVYDNDRIIGRIGKDNSLYLVDDDCNIISKIDKNGKVCK